MQGFVQTNGTISINGTLAEWEDVLADIDHARYRSGVVLEGSKELENVVERLKEMGNGVNMPTV